MFCSPLRLFLSLLIEGKGYQAHNWTNSELLEMAFVATAPSLLIPSFATTLLLFKQQFTTPRSWFKFNTSCQLVFLDPPQIYGNRLGWLHSLGEPSMGKQDGALNYTFLLTLTSVVVGGMAGDNTQGTQPHIAFPLSYKIKEMAHRRPKLAKATTEEEMMTCESKKNKRKKGSGQVLPHAATTSYNITQPFNYDHLLFSKDAYFGLQWLPHISIIPSFLRSILYPKSLMFCCRWKQRNFLLSFSVETEYPPSA